MQRMCFFFFQAEDGIRDGRVTGVQTCALPISGREIRVIVSPGDVDDDSAALLSHEIAREIEDRLEYPGQVKVTVIRESRAVDVARNHGRSEERRVGKEGRGRWAAGEEKQKEGK